MSSIETDADVNIKINAEDNASLVIDESTKRINRSFQQMRIQQRQATREFEVNNRVLTAGGRVLQSFGRIVGRTIAIYNTFQLHQLRLQQSNERLRDSQLEVNQAFLEFGEGSPEHVSSVKRQDDIRKENKRIKDDEFKNNALLALVAVTSAGQVINRVVPSLLRFKSAVGFRGASPAGLGGGTGAGLLGKAGTAISKFPKAGLPIIGAGLFASELLGSQTAGAPLADAQGNELAGQPDISSESGVDAILRTGGEIITIINNIFAPTSQEIVDELGDNTIQSLPFGRK